jgi:glycosyltransferase involved in cell wall biosynthesis
LVDPRDPTAIADAVQNVLDDEPLARKLSESGRARAAEFTWAKTAAGLGEIYRELRGAA